VLLGNEPGRLSTGLAGSSNPTEATLKGAILRTAMPQMSAEEVAYGAHDAFSRGDREAFVAFWAEECEYQPALERDIAGEADSFRGHDGIRRWWQGMLDAWSDSETQVHELRRTGDELLIAITLRAEGRGSGVTIEARFFQVATIRAGKILLLRDFSDRDQALEAAGLRE
jgi:ketosteroid isomerase-like protein